MCDYTDMGRGYQNQKYCGLHIKIGPQPSQKAWMKLHDETATAIAFSFIDLETEACLSLVSGVKVKERLNVRL